MPRMAMVLLSVYSVFVVGCRGTNGDEVLTNTDVEMLVEAGVPADVIVSKIRVTRPAFNTSVEQLVALSQAGLPTAVVDAMITSSATANPQQDGSMGDSQDQIIDVMSALTSQLMVMAAGVFAIVGGIVAARTQKLKGVRCLLTSLGAFTLSALCGYFLQGLMISELQAGKVDPGGWLAFWGLAQFSLFLAASALFVWFVGVNLRDSLNVPQK